MTNKAHAMAWLCDPPLLIVWVVALFLLQVTNGAEIFLEWHVALNTTIKPVSVDQPVYAYMIFASLSSAKIADPKLF